MEKHKNGYPVSNFPKIPNSLPPKVNPHDPKNCAHEKTGPLPYSATNLLKTVKFTSPKMLRDATKSKAPVIP